jgi:hypothetical protein
MGYLWTRGKTWWAGLQSPHTGTFSQVPLCPWGWALSSYSQTLAKCHRAEALTVYKTKLVIDEAQHHIHDRAELWGEKAWISAGSWERIGTCNTDYC